MTIFSVGNHIWNNTKKWWAEGERKFKEIEIDSLGFWIMQDAFDGSGMKGNIKIKAAKSYLREDDILKYILEDINGVKIGYYEGEPVKTITMNTDGGIV